MTAAIASSPAVRPQPAPRAAAVALTDAALLVGTRVALWVGVQAFVAGVILVASLPGGGEPLNAAAGWWMVYGAVIDLATLAILMRVIRRHGVTYRSLLGPRTPSWQVAIGAAAVLAASAPAIFFSSELNTAIYGDVTPPMLAVVDVPAPAAAFSVVVWPLLAELAEPVAYLGVILPALERRLGQAWLAAAIVVAIWAAEHAFFPILLTEGGVDVVFAAYRVISVLPFLAIWTALYYVFGRRLLPLMAARWIFNGGTALAIGLGLV
jgi:hypothetical protein